MGGGRGSAGARSMLNAGAEVNEGEAVPCVYARLSATGAWVI